LVPGLVQIGVEALYPPPSRVTLVNLTREAGQRAEETLTRMEGNHSKKEGSDDSYKDFLDRKVKAHEHMDDSLHELLSQFDEQLAQQQRLVQWLQVLSPSVVVREGVAELSGESVHRYQRFKEQAETFHDERQAFFFGKIKRGESLMAPDVANLKAFHYEAEPLGDRLGRLLVGLASVWGWTLLLLLAGFSRTKHIGRL